MLSREQLEKKQLWLYASVLIIASGVGLLLPESSIRLDRMISFILAILMYGMITQIPFFSFERSTYESTVHLRASINELHSCPYHCVGNN